MGTRLTSEVRRLYITSWKLMKKTSYQSNSGLSVGVSVSIQVIYHVVVAKE
jgi:hypothetical protein